MFRLPPASCWKAAQGRVGQPSSAQMARSGGHSTLTVSHGLFSSLLVLLGKGEGDDSASLGGIFTILPPSSSPDTQAARLWIPSPSSLSSGPLFQFLPLPSLAKSKSQLGHSSSSDSSPSSPHLPPSPQSQLRTQVWLGHSPAFVPPRAPYCPRRKSSAGLRTGASPLTFPMPSLLSAPKPLPGLS